MLREDFHARPPPPRTTRRLSVRKANALFDPIAAFYIFMILLIIISIHLRFVKSFLKIPPESLLNPAEVPPNPAGKTEAGQSRLKVSAMLPKLSRDAAIMEATARCLTFRQGDATMGTRRCIAWSQKI